MTLLANRRKFLGILAATFAGFLVPAIAQTNNPGGRKRVGKGGRGRREAEDYALPSELAAFGLLSLVLGRVSARSVTVSALANEPLEGYFEYGTASGNYSRKTSRLSLPAGQPVDSVFDNLQPNTEYFYRLQFRRPAYRQL